MGIFIGATIGVVLAVLLFGVWCSLLVAGDLDREMEKNRKRSKKNGK